VTRPGHRNTPALSAAVSGAVDLGALKARADAARQRAAQPGGATKSQWVLDVDEASFASVIERSQDVPVVVELTTARIPEAVQLSAVLERAATASGGTWLLAKVDLEVSPRIGQVFGVQSAPTVVAVAAGQPVDGFAGPIPENTFSQWIKRLLDALRDQLPGIKAAEANAGSAPGVEESEDARFVAAEEAFQRGDFAAAESAYEAILANEPSNVDAKAALAHVRFSVRVEGLPADAVVRADAQPDDIAAQLAAADFLAASQNVEQAFQRLIDTIRQVRGEDRDRVKAHLIGLFELFPVEDPRVGAARRKLASALF
jgi:putative thioredoxin